MSFTTHQIKLKGSPVRDLPLKTCSKCGHDKDPGGGIDIGPGKWRCAACWVGSSNSRNRRIFRS